MEKMTIHRALAELKLIDNKIEKAIKNIQPTGIVQKDRLVNNLYQKEVFEKEAKSKYQSVNDLITRKNKIKCAIVKKNGETKVTIADKEMTIADAINYKTIVDFKKMLIKELSGKHEGVKTKFEVNNEEVNKVALENAQIMLGRQGDEKVKPTDEDVKKIIQPFIKRNEYHMVDPLGVEKVIEDTEKEVIDFETEVDAALSEINATTLIEF